MRPPLLLLTALLTVACTAPHVDVRPAPEDALNRAESRLRARGIKVDPSSKGPTRIRTATYCYRGADRFGFDWDRAFARQVMGPIGFAHIGTFESQDKRAEQCALIFRVTIRARRQADMTRLKVNSEWWRLKRKRCIPHGLPAMARFQCRYAYIGTTAPRDIRRHMHGVLRDL